MNNLNTMLAEKAPKPGFVRYVYPHSELVEIYRAAFAEGRVAEASAFLKTRVSGSMIMDAIGEARKSQDFVPKVESKPIIVKAIRRVESRYCRRCGGPLSIVGNTYCDEC